MARKSIENLSIVREQDLLAAVKAAIASFRQIDQWCAENVNGRSQHWLAVLARRTSKKLEDAITAWNPHEAGLQSEIEQIEDLPRGDKRRKARKVAIEVVRKLPDAVHCYIALPDLVETIAVIIAKQYDTRPRK